MAYKKVPHEVKVNALKEAIQLKGTEIIVQKYGISRHTIKNDFDKVIGQIDTIIQNKKPGRKVKAKKVIKISERKPKRIEKSKEDLTCPECGSKNISKNGTYPVVNWLLRMIVLLLPFVKTNIERVIQKYICADCMTSVAGKQRMENNYIKQAMKLQIAKLICILRFKEGLSVRAISYIIKTIFGANGSIGYIVDLCDKVAQKGKEKLVEINNCSQCNAKTMIFDETFPTSKTSGTTNLGIVMDENGLIRGVQTILEKKRDIKKLFKSVLSAKYNPDYFLSDYDSEYPVIIQEVKKGIVIMKDFVHGTRQIYRDMKTAINKVTVGGISSLTKQKQKAITDMKKRLLTKQVNRILYRLRKGFKSRYASVGTIYLEGALEELKELSTKFPSLGDFYKKTSKFINKYIDIWAVQMEASVKEGIPTTSNILESMNSIFKAFMKKAKCYESSNSLDCFFSTVALMQNFDIKTRGKNAGTSAIMRAGIDLDEFGAKDFFEAVNLRGIVLGEGAIDSIDCINVDIENKELVA